MSAETVDGGAAPVSKSDRLALELAGLDALDAAGGAGERAPSRSVRLWRAMWPRAVAVVLFVGAWQIVVWSRWRPDYVLPGPAAVAGRLGELAGEGRFWQAVATTVRRGLTGFAFAVVFGTVIALGVSRFRTVRAGVGSFISGLQSMPSIAWFPLAVLLFQLNESAIFFVVVIGAAPSVANGLLSGIDHVPPLLRRAGQVLGARGLSAYRHVVIPAALPAYLAGLKQGWAFAWRSLMAAEIFVVIIGGFGLGSLLNAGRELLRMDQVMGVMAVVMIVGLLADLIFFSPIEGWLRRSRGLER